MPVESRRVVGPMAVTNGKKPDFFRGRTQSDFSGALPSKMLVEVRLPKATGNAKAGEKE